MEATLPRSNPAPFLPQPSTVEETGIDSGLILDLTLKTIYYAGRPSARSICERVCLPFAIMEGLLEFLRREEQIEIVGSGGIMEQDYQYALTAKGCCEGAGAAGPEPLRGPCAGALRPV